VFGFVDFCFSLFYFQSQERLTKIRELKQQDDRYSCAERLWHITRCINCNFDVFISTPKRTDCVLVNCDIPQQLTTEEAIKRLGTATTKSPTNDRKNQKAGQYFFSKLHNIILLESDENRKIEK
jgi:hypothetical protein